MLTPVFIRLLPRAMLCRKHLTHVDSSIRPGQVLLLSAFVGTKRSSERLSGLPEVAQPLSGPALGFRPISHVRG